MKEEKGLARDYASDLAEIRSMMERTSRFLSLAGWAGIMAGIYALAGAYIAWDLLDFNPSRDAASHVPANLPQLLGLAIAVLVLAIGTAIFLSQKKASKRGEKLWNPTAKRLVISMAVPLVTGGLLILALIDKGLVDLMAPASLLFYGLAVFNASKYTYEDVRGLGFIQLALGLFSAWFTQYGLLCWALGFGIVHIIYGIYLHYRYER